MWLLDVQGPDDVADAQHGVRLVGEEPEVVQARAGAAGEGHIVHGLLAVHPGRVQGLPVLDGFRQAEAETGVVLVGAGHVGDADVEVVEPGDFRAAAEVVALLEPLGMLGSVEEVDEEPQGVLHADDLAEAAHGPGRQPLAAAAERRVVGLRPVQVGGRPDAEPERPGGGLGPCLQDRGCDA